MKKGTGEFIQEEGNTKKAVAQLRPGISIEKGLQLRKELD